LPRRRHPHFHPLDRPGKRKQVGGLGARRRNPQQCLDQVMGYAFGANPPCGWIVENMRKKPFSPLLDAA
jgi:hypothetical protein